MSVTEKTYLPRDIREMQKLRDSLQAEDAYDNLIRFSNALLATTNKYSSATNEAIELALAENWLFRFDYHINNISLSTFLLAHYDNCAKLLKSKNVLEKLATDSHNEQLLAILCLRRVAITQASKAMPSSEVKSLLNQWLSVEMSDEMLTSVTKVATLIYGPGFMALYGDDTNTPEELINLVAKMNLPVVKYGTVSAAPYLPSNLIG